MEKILTIIMLILYVGSPVYCTIAVIMVERKIDRFNNGIRDIIDLQMQILEEGKNEL